MQGWKNFPEMVKFSSQQLFYKGEIIEVTNKMFKKIKGAY